MSEKSCNSRKRNQFSHFRWRYKREDEYDKIGKKIEGFSETVNYKIQRQEGGYLGMLLGPSKLGNMLTGKGVKRAGKGVARTEAIYNNKGHMGKNV